MVFLIGDDLIDVCVERVLVGCLGGGGFWIKVDWTGQSVRVDIRRDGLVGDGGCDMARFDNCTAYDVGGPKPPAPLPPLPPS